jgi:hypothetical protein
MNGNDPHTPNPSDEDDVARSPEDADEDQLDEALEETFPASDPISP